MISNSYYIIILVFSGGKGVGDFYSGCGHRGRYSTLDDLLKVRPWLSSPLPDFSSFMHCGVPPHGESIHCNCLEAQKSLWLV